jgi:inner membrane transporter RhtA
MCVGTLAVAPLGIAEGAGQLLTGESLLLGAAIGVLSSVIPYSFEVEALRRIAAPVFGVLMSLEPGVAALAGFLVVGQQISLRLVIGIAMVIVASVGVTRAGRSVPVAV